MSEPKTPTSQETKPAREIDEQTRKHIERFLQGKDAWNKWANEMLARKAELEKVGKWKVWLGFDNEKRRRNISADTSIPEIQAWLDETFVDFSNLTFQKIKDKKIRGNVGFFKSTSVFSQNSFAGFVFPGQVVFNKSEFNENVNFHGAKFKGETEFLATTFNGEVDFSETQYEVRVNFTGCIFKEFISFFEAEFQMAVDFTGVEFPRWTIFCNAEFKGESNFLYAEFQGLANFSGAEFQELVCFEETVFKGRAEFRWAEFHKKADFNDVEFHGVAEFSNTEFLSKTDFSKSIFHDITRFHFTIFHGKTNFKQVDFETHVNFFNAEFKKHSDFEAILVKRAFNLADAGFSSNVPIFNQANFAESPRLDHIEVLPAPKYEAAPNLFGSLKWQRYFWRKKFISYLFRIIRRIPIKLVHILYFPLHHIFKRLRHSCIQFFNTRRNPDEEAHYRALKRLAIQAHDHENEMKFFAGEIRARRHITDFANFLTHDFASSMRYWAGVAYEAFSDFGRSFIRPALWWFACLWLFANLTLSGAGLEDKTKCHNSQLTPKEAAYTIGLKNSLLILGLTKTNIVKQAELCLYGLNKNEKAESKQKPYDPKIKRSYQAKSTKGEVTKTDIPFKAAVQGITHSLLSLLFIFLLLLAIRNQFKIK